MKTIEISDELYNKIIKNQNSPDEDFDSVLKRILNIRGLETSEAKKMVFVGEAGVGKSTIRKIFFEYNNPQELLENSLEPTRGLEFFSYDMFDLNCSVLDTSGQELRDWIRNEQEQVFTEADFIIVVTPASSIKEERKFVYDLVKEIGLLANLYAKNIIVSLFVHKIDLIDDSKLELFKKECKEDHKAFELAEEIDIPIFFTSIKPDYLKELNLAFMKLFRIESLILPNYQRYLNDL